MKKHLLMVILAILPLCLFAQTNIKETLPKTYADIKKKATDKWVGDFEMQKYQIDKQCKALSDYLDLVNNTPVPEDVFQQIGVNALTKWCDNDWLKCVKDNPNDRDNILSCFSADWEMVLYEMKNQIKAYKELN